MINDNTSQLKLGGLALAKLWRGIIVDPDVQTYIANRGITWKNMVEYAPWKGGFYERLVGIVK